MGHPLARGVLAPDGRVGRPAAHRKIVAADDDGAPVHRGAPEHEVGRREAREVVLLVVGRATGELAQLVKGPRVHELRDALADRVAAPVVLPLHPLGPAELLGELLAVPELVHLRLPVLAGSVVHRSTPSPGERCLLRCTLS